MPEQVAKLILPFAVPVEDRIRAFTKDVERAACMQRQTLGKLLYRYST